MNLLMFETAAIALCNLVMLSIDAIFDIPFPISDILSWKSLYRAYNYESLFSIKLLDKPVFHPKVIRP
jgi:hypothetical protein